MGFWIGVAMILGGMDLVRVIPYRFGQGQPPVHTAWFQRRRPTAVTKFRTGWGGRLEVCLLPGGRRPPGLDDIGRGVGGMAFGEYKKRNRWCSCFINKYILPGSQDMCT